jgi:hypothetical protein
MQTYEVKKVDAVDLTSRVEWEIESLKYRYWVACMLCDILERKMRAGKAVNRFVKVDFDKAREGVVVGSTFDRTAKSLGVERTYTVYQNTAHMGQETFEFECKWWQTDPFPPAHNRGTGRQTTYEGISLKYIPRFLTKEALDSAFIGYVNMYRTAQQLEESLPLIGQACERYNAALEEVVAASQVLPAEYPYSQAFPFYGTRL